MALQMMRVVIAFFACVNPVVVQAFPGSMLNGRWPPMRVPAQIQQFPSHLAKASEASAGHSPIRLSLPDIVRNAVLCCKDMTAECMACATNQDLSHFCKEHAHIPGCQTLIDRARERAVDGVVNKAVEKMAEKVGGVKAEQLVDQYLERNPDAARQNLANLTSEALDTVSSLKKSMLQPREIDQTVPKKRVKASKGVTKVRKTRVGAPKDEDPVDDEDSVLADNEAEDVGFAPENDAFSFKNVQRNPWVIAICSLLVTAVSTGIALGALCHARIGSHAREPLLSTHLQDIESNTPTASSA